MIVKHFRHVTFGRKRYITKIFGKAISASTHSGSPLLSADLYYKITSVKEPLHFNVNMEKLQLLQKQLHAELSGSIRRDSRRMEKTKPIQFLQR